MAGEIKTTVRLTQKNVKFIERRKRELGIPMNTTVQKSLDLAESEIKPSKKSK